MKYISKENIEIIKTIFVKILINKIKYYNLKCCKSISMGIHESWVA